MATRRTHATRKPVIPTRKDLEALDAYIKYLKALIKIVCKPDLRWSAATGIKVTKICPPPERTGTRKLIVSKAACPPPPGGWSDLCMVLNSLLEYLEGLRARMVG